MAELGYSRLTVDELVGARDHGVDPQYVGGLAALGYKGIQLAILIKMRDHGVGPEFVKRVQAGGAGRLSPDELIQRRDRGDENPNAAAHRMLTTWHSFLKAYAPWLAAWMRG